MPAIAVHLLAQVPQVPRVVAKNWTPRGLTLGALAAPAVAALLLSPLALPGPPAT